MKGGEIKTWNVYSDDTDYNKNQKHPFWR